MSLSLSLAFRPGPAMPAPLVVWIASALSLLAASPVAGEDQVTLKDGKTLKGELLDLTDAKVAIRVGGETQRLARSDVASIERSAEERVIQFVEKKLLEYSKGATVDAYRKLADLALKRGCLPEERSCLRKIVELEPDNADARKRLGHARLDGGWVDDEKVEASLKAGYVQQGDQLVKSNDTVTSVKEAGELPSSYKVHARTKLSDRDRKRLEKERADALKNAEKFQREKAAEYEGVEWNERHEIKTDHFIILCNSTREVAQRYAALMEMIRAEHSKMFQSRIRRNIRAPIFIYKSQEEFMTNDDYGRWAGRGLGGYYMPSSQTIKTYHGTFGFTSTTFNVLAHEGTHYFQGLVLKDFDNIPMWLIEGLAVYFGDGSTFDPKTRKIEIGGVPRDRLSHIQEKIQFGRHTPVSKLVGMTRRTGFSGSQYADAWALIYFLVKSGEKGQNFLRAYWTVGLDNLLTKKNFDELAQIHFGGTRELETSYLDYVRSLPVPPAGEVKGEYFVSDLFQFDFKAPSEEWEFFEDREDKKLLIGLILPGKSAEIRIYYENNITLQSPEELFAAYMRVAKSRFKDVKSEPTKIANLDGYKIQYVDERKNVFSGIDIEIGDDGEVVVLPKDGEGEKGEKDKKKEPEKPREVTKYLLIQMDGLVSIECHANVGEGAQHAAVFDKANELFSLRPIRRW